MSIHSAVETECCCGDDSARRDCLLTVAEAVAVALSMVAPVRDIDVVDIGKAPGRIAACDMHAPRPMPFFDQSAMDGFAVRCTDLEGPAPWRLPVSGTIAAGDCRGGETMPDGVALRIFTGAPVPPDAGAVVMIEDCGDTGDFVTIRRRPQRGENIRPCGSDIGRGALLVTAGTRIESRHVGLLAANGHNALGVFRRPRVGVFSTGRELLGKGAPEDGRIFDANRPMLISLAESAGAEVSDLGTVDDDADETARFFTGLAGRYDMVVSSGAVSAGGRDFIRPSFERAGGTIRAWKIAMKPGKPVLFGTLGDTAFIGLPGNPLAAFVGFELFGREQILRLCGTANSDARHMRAIAGFSAQCKTGRTEYVPARITDYSPEGLPILGTVGNGSSGTLHALCQANGLAVLDAERQQIEPGDRLGFLPVFRA